MVLVLLLASMGAASSVSGEQPSTDQVKAAFLYNFAKFVEWPPGTFDQNRAVIYLGILAKEPLAGAIESLQGKEVHGRKLMVRRCHGLDDVKKCHIFFASASEKRDLAGIMGSLRGQPLLTVFDELDDFAKIGGIINLTIAEDKIRFSISLNNAEKSGLKISSQLLKLAIRVSN